MIRWLLIATILFPCSGECTRNIHSPCHILLNEVSTTSPAFLEIAKICPPNGENTNTGLAGYNLLVLDPQTLELKFFKALDKLKLIPVISVATTVESNPSAGKATKSHPKSSASSIQPKPVSLPSQNGPNKDIPTPPLPAVGEKIKYPQQTASSGSTSSTTASQKTITPVLMAASPIQNSGTISFIAGVQEVAPPGQNRNIASESTQLNSQQITDPSPVQTTGKSITTMMKGDNGNIGTPSARPTTLKTSGYIVSTPVAPKSTDHVGTTSFSGLHVHTENKNNANHAQGSVAANKRGTLIDGHSEDHLLSNASPKGTATGSSSTSSSSQIGHFAAGATGLAISGGLNSKSDTPQQRSQSNQVSQSTVNKPQPKPVKSTNQESVSTTNRSQQASKSQSPSGSPTCSNYPDCQQPPKKPRRSKRDLQFVQPNVWGVRDVDFGNVLMDFSKAYVVALTYLPYCKRTSLWDRYRVGQVLSPEVQEELRDYTHDLLIFSGAQEDDVSKLVKVLPDGADLTYIEPASELSSYSYSKCDKSLSPFNPEGFIHSDRTKGMPNMCPVYEEPDPFTFKGKNLKIQSQQLVVNVVTNLRKKISDESWRRLTPVEAAASLLNLGRTTVYRIMQKYDAGDEFTEGKKQCRRRPVTDLPPKWRSILYRSITGYYQKNLVPRVAYVLKDFVQAVRTQQLEDLEKQQKSVPALENMAVEEVMRTGHVQTQDDGAIVDFDDERPAPELYHCSARSFTKILDCYGYKYGKIRNRDSQIFRPVNLKWRALYLEAIAKYEADPAWNVVYLDETWVDPHQRANRGIVLKKYENFQQRKDFTFKDDKISRGSRLIILAAGREDGFIHEATELFAVSVNAKKKRTDQDAECSSAGLEQDYHDNVKGPKFLQWLDKLFKILENKKSVFVMDNCPFHKVLGIPKTSDKKEVIRQWLEEKKAEGHNIPEDVSPATKLTKVTLLGIVGRLTTDDDSVDTKIPRTQVQQLARQYGHRVLLLPPYNCDLNPIEEVWNDIKTEVKEKNTDQSVSFAMDLADRALRVYTKEKWQAHIRHTQKLRNEYREGDKVFSAREAALESDEVIAEELSDADYTAIDQEITTEEDEQCVYEEIEK